MSAVQKALLVDDSAWIHSLVRAQLGRDFEISSAFDGESGLVRANEIKPEFILLDVDLPDLHGYEVCRRLKDSAGTRGVPVIFLSSMTSVEQRIGGLDCGACDYITKPVDPLELRARVRAVMREKQTADRFLKNALIDRTTGLFNRRYLETRLDGELARARRSGHSLACLMIGLDGTIGDGHSSDLVREDALYTIGELARNVCRGEDVVCRFSRDAIAVLAICVNEAAAKALGERIQYAVHSCRDTTLHRSGHISVSIGTALSRFSTGMRLVYEASEALSKATASLEKIFH